MIGYFMMKKQMKCYVICVAQPYLKDFVIFKKYKLFLLLVVINIDQIIYKTITKLFSIIKPKNYYKINQEQSSRFNILGLNQIYKVEIMKISKQIWSYLKKLGKQDAIGSIMIIYKKKCFVHYVTNKEKKIPLQIMVNFLDKNI